MMIWPTDKTGQEDNFYVNFLHLEKKDDDETLSQQVEEVLEQTKVSISKANFKLCFIKQVSLIPMKNSIWSIWLSCC